MPQDETFASSQPQDPQKPAKKRRTKSARSKAPAAAAAAASAAPASAAPAATPFTPPPSADPNAPVKAVQAVQAGAPKSEEAPAHAPAPKSMAEARRIRMAETAEGYEKLRATLAALKDAADEPWAEPADVRNTREEDGRNEPAEPDEREEHEEHEEYEGHDDLNEEPDVVAMDALGAWEAFEGEEEKSGRNGSGGEVKPAAPAAQPEKTARKAPAKAPSKQAEQTKPTKPTIEPKRSKGSKGSKGSKASELQKDAEDAQDAHAQMKRETAEPDGLPDGLFAGTDAAGVKASAAARSNPAPDPFLVPRGPNRRLSTSREALAGALGRNVAATAQPEGDPEEPNAARAEPEAVEAVDAVDAVEAVETAGAHFTRLEGRRVRLPGDIPPRPIRDLLDPEVALSLERISNPGWGGKLLAEGARLWQEENALREEALFAALSAGPGIPTDEKTRLAREAEAAQLYADPAQSGFTGEISARPELWAVFRDDVAGAQTTALRLDCRGLEKRITELARADVADPRIPPLVEHYEALSTRLQELTRLQTKEGEKAAKRVSRLGASGFAGVPAAPLSQADRFTQLLSRLRGGPDATPAAPRSTPTEAWLAALARRNPADAPDRVGADEEKPRPEREALLDQLWSALGGNEPSTPASGQEAAGTPQTPLDSAPSRFITQDASAAGEPTLFGDLGAQQPAEGPALEAKLKALQARKTQAAEEAAPENEAEGPIEAGLSPVFTGANPSADAEPRSKDVNEIRENPNCSMAAGKKKEASEEPFREKTPGNPDAAATQGASKTGSQAASKADGRKRTGGLGFAAGFFPSANRRRAAAVVLAALIAAPVLSRALFPAPAFAVVDRDLVETQVALLRLTHAQPGIPERADLKELDAEAIDRAVSLTAAQAGLPLMDRRAVLSTAGAEPLDLTEAVFERLGVTPADRAALADALAHGWTADVNLALEEAARTAQTGGTGLAARHGQNEGASQGVAQSAADRADRDASRSTARRLLAEAGRVEANPPLPQADQDFGARVKRLLKTIRGEAADDPLTQTNNEGARR